MGNGAREGLLDLVDAVFAVNGGFLQAGDVLGREAGITAAQWQVLGLLEHGPETAAEVARRRGLRRQSVQATVDRLLAAGRLERLDNPADRRAPLLAVTGSGRRALDSVTAARERWLNELAHGCDPAEIGQAVAVLSALRKRLGVPPRDTPQTTAPVAASR